MTRQYKNILYSRQLSRQECKNCLDEIIEILKTRKVLEIEMMFGFAWGNEYKEWTPFTVSPDEITIEIDKAEKSGTGSFYNDDTFLYLRELHSEILFCHEYDIHLEFDQPNEVVNDIIEAWKSKNIIQEKV